MTASDLDVRFSRNSNDRGKRPLECGDLSPLSPGLSNVSGKDFSSGNAMAGRKTDQSGDRSPYSKEGSLANGCFDRIDSFHCLDGGFHVMYPDDVCALQNGRSGRGQRAVESICHGRWVAICIGEDAADE